MIDLPYFKIEQHIKEFATSDESAHDYLISRGVCEDHLSYFADLLRVLAKDFVAGKGCSREFWQIMSRHAHEIADEEHNQSFVLNSMFAESMKLFGKL